MEAFTIKEIQGLVAPRQIIDVVRENKWLVLLLDNGVRFKILA